MGQGTQGPGETGGNQAGSGLPPIGWPPPSQAKQAETKPGPALARTSPPRAPPKPSRGRAVQCELILSGANSDFIAN